MIVPSYVTRISTSVPLPSSSVFKKVFCKCGWSQSFHQRVSYCEISYSHCGYETSNDFKVDEGQHIRLKHSMVTQYTGHPSSNYIEFSDVKNAFSANSASKRKYVLRITIQIWSTYISLGP